MVPSDIARLIIIIIIYCFLNLLLLFTPFLKSFYKSLFNEIEFY